MTTRIASKHDDEDMISIKTLHNVKNIKIYKVLTGRETLASYNNSVVKSAARDTLDGSLERVEWRAMYTQFLPDHTLGTLPYRWERHGDLSEHKEATLTCVTFESLNVLVLDGPMFHDGSLDGTTKAAAVKRALGIEPHLPLMETLGKQGKVAMVRETEAEWELVIPHELLEGCLKFVEEPMIRFQRFSNMPMTQKYCILRGDADNANNQWQGWNEGETEKELEETVLPPLPTEWIDS